MRAALEKVWADRKRLGRCIQKKKKKKKKNHRRFAASRKKKKKSGQRLGEKKNYLLQTPGNSYASPPSWETRRVLERKAALPAPFSSRAITRPHLAIKRQGKGLLELEPNGHGLRPSSERKKGERESVLYQPPNWTPSKKKDFFVDKERGDRWHALGSPKKKTGRGRS